MGDGWCVLLVCREVGRVMSVCVLLVCREVGRVMGVCVLLVLLVCREVGRVMGGVCYWCVGRWGGVCVCVIGV